MTIELTEAQRQALQADHGSPVDVVDPVTRERYVLLAREVFERVQSIMQPRTSGQSAQPLPERINENPVPEMLSVSASIRQSQESFWRNLPELLKDRRNKGLWVCYHRDERIGIGNYEELIRECVRRGLPENEYDIEVIEPHASPPWEPEEIEAGGHELDSVD
jgi:hypothetical protein